MPRFYCDIEICGHATIDSDGVEVANESEAETEALVILLDTARASLPKGSRSEFVASVRDEAGAVLFTKTLAITCERHGEHTVELGSCEAATSEA